MKDDIEKHLKGGQIKQLQDFIKSEFNYKLLSRRKRLLVFIAACQAAVKPELLKGLIKWSLSSNVKPSEIYEVLLQGYLFCGYPTAIESFFVFNEVIENKFNNHFKLPKKNVIWDYDRFKKRGLKTAKKIYGSNLDLVLGNIQKLSADLASSMVVEGYGRVISRKGLDILTRELAIVASLTVTGMSRQLYSHIRGAVNVGASPAQIKAAINQSLFFANPSKVKKALQVFKKSLGIRTHQR